MAYTYRIHLGDRRAEAYQREAARWGVPLSELMRRILDDWCAYDPLPSEPRAAGGRLPSPPEPEPES